MIARREVLRGGCACALAFVAGCGRAPGPAGEARVDSGPVGDDGDDSGRVDSGPVDSGPVDTGPCDDDTGTDVDGWIEVPLADYPALRTPGGHAYVEVPDRLLNVTVVHRASGCFTSLWRICTHGACSTEWVPEDQSAVCPCHGSVFAVDGAIVVGPATVPLRAFETVRRGDSLWIRR